jgi:hypothetical protein
VYKIHTSTGTRVFNKRVQSVTLINYTRLIRLFILLVTLSKDTRLVRTFFFVFFVVTA